MAIHIIEALLPGVFYLSPAADDPPFKQPGDRVAVGDTLGLIEVMKAFLPVEAEVAGTLVRFVVASDSTLDVGDPICEIQI